MTGTTRPEDFFEFYWLKEELQDFCRRHNLSAAGRKKDCERRIEHFLRTGERLAPESARAAVSDEARRLNEMSASALSMTTRAPQGFRFTQEVRRFFEAHLGKTFRFTVTLQQFVKSHPGATFSEIAEEWRRQQALKRAGQWRPEIAPQFEYNQFTRDFYADPGNTGKNRQDCIDAWNRTRTRRGSHKYDPMTPERTTSADSLPAPEPLASNADADPFALNADALADECERCSE